jgi:hypothetical protein
MPIIRPVSPPLADTVSAHIMELPLTQEVPHTFESLTPIEPIQPLTVDLTGRPRRASAANAQTPGFYRHLTNVDSTNTPRNPYDDINGCNMHFAKAASDYGHDLATAAGTKEVMNTMGPNLTPPKGNGQVIHQCPHSTSCVAQTHTQYDCTNVDSASLMYLPPIYKLPT